MKRVLVITYYWPPGGGAGVHRWLKFVKYLRAFGWEPVVYTSENPESPVLDHSLEAEVPEGITVLKRKIWEPYNAYKRFVGRNKNDRIKTGFLSENVKPALSEKISVWIRGNLFIPDARCFWIKPSVNFLIHYLKNQPVDAMVSTGPPHSMHMIAHALKKETGIPWLADFRDPWTNIDYYQDLMLTKRSDAIHRKLERDVLQSADEVVVVSKGMAGDFSRLIQRDYKVITNGFDGPLAEPASLPVEKFSLIHIGSLVPARNPENLWKALSQLVNTVDGFGEDLEIRLIGQIDISVKNLIARYGLNEFTSFESYLSHSEALKVQREAQVLLLIINNTPNARLIVTGKLFEYLQAGRPVLSIGPTDGDAAYIINESRAGQNIGYDNPEGIMAVLRTYYQLYKQGKLSIQPENIDRYSRRNLTGELAELLNEMVHQ